MTSATPPTVYFKPPAVPDLEKVSCADFMEFQDALKKSRVIDDKIVYELNATVPTDSFARGINVSERCESLYKQLRSAYASRDSAIKRCVSDTQKKVEEMRKLHESDPNNTDLLKRLRKIQSSLRLLQSEINVEEVVKDRSLKVFYERCRSAYKPPENLGM